MAACSSAIFESNFTGMSYSVAKPKIGPGSNRHPRVYPLSSAVSHDLQIKLFPSPMKTSDVDILVVPGWSSSGPDHWQSRWHEHFKSATRVEQDDWVHPRRDAWTGRLIAAAEQTNRDIVLVGHSVGVMTIAHAAPQLPQDRTLGAFLVAPADVENADQWPLTQGVTFSETGSDLAPIPRHPLPFPSHLIASTNDPYCAPARAREFAIAWNATFVDAGDIGHINVDSGHGPWPEGLLRFAKFMKEL